jgi:ribosome biogenesis GTPase
MLHGAVWRSDLPAVGDWVATRVWPEEGKATIHAVLPRKSVFSRKVAHSRTEQQVVAANVDTVFLVSGLDRDFNVRRIERYLTLAWESGATPVIVLNKTDLCSDVAHFVADVESVAVGVPIHPVSAKENQGLDSLRRYLAPGETVALLGSSGVGKSTLLNTLLGTERQRTAPVRERDQRGRHATAHRELVFLPGGGMLIDNPGMRELQMWTDDEALAETFDDITLLAARCRFRDCRHDSEPGCAVREAIENGTLDEARLRSYWRLQREIRHLETRRDQKARLVERAKKRRHEKRSREQA